MWMSLTEQLYRARAAMLQSKRSSGTEQAEHCYRACTAVLQSMHSSVTLGLPRLITVIVLRCLMAGYAEQRNNIATPEKQNGKRNRKTRTPTLADNRARNTI